MQKYLAELIGTFFLVLTAVLATNSSNVGAMAPLAIGLMLTVMVYAGGHISGGHFNPAVTLAAMMRGKLETNDAITYVVAQVLGALAAAAIGVYLHGSSGEGAIPLHGNPDPFAALLAEFLGAFALAYVYLNVYTTEKNNGNSFYGLAIGLTLTAGLFAFRGVSGGVLNPATAIGGAAAGMYFFYDLWIYLIGGFAGAAAAATVFTVVYGRGD